jgi:Rod binding domain-containing protein
MSTISALTNAGSSASPELQATFRNVVGGLFYGQLLKSLRDTVGKPAYIHGGQAEELFQSQLDQYLVDDLSSRQSGPWLDELFQQFLAQLQPNGSPAPAAQPAQLAQPEQSAATASLAQLSEAARRAKPAPEGAGITTAATALSGLIRK